MIWGFLAAVLILGLAYALRRAVKGTRFTGRCPCTPYVEHLRWLEEDGKKAQAAKKENLW